MRNPADHLLLSLKTRGAQETRALAGQLGVSRQAALQALERLAAEALVTHIDQRRGVGRPRRLWSLSERGHARFPDTHAQLTLEMLEAIRDEFGEDGVDRLIARRERAAEAAYAAALTSAEGLEERIAKLAQLRAAEGYMAEWRKVGDGWLLVENHCPICAAAAACQGFCRAELELFRTALGPDAKVERTDHILAGARRCAYRITARATPPGPAA